MGSSYGRYDLDAPANVCNVNLVVTWFIPSNELWIILVSRGYLL